MKRKVVLVLLWMLFLLAWCYGVVKLTRYLGSKEELGKVYHEVDPAGFDENKKTGSRY